MEHTEGSFQGSGGLDLHRQSWRPSGETRAALAIVHGMGEHSGRYGNVVDALVPKGYAIHGFDLRGCGRSPGQRGHIDAWSQFRDDVRAFLCLVGEAEPGLPLFLMGHSMGGLIVLDYVLRYSHGLAGTIASAPGLEPRGVAKPWMVGLAKVLTRVWPSFALDVELEAAAISRDPAVVEAYANDPLCHAKGSVRWGTESLAAIRWIKAHPGDLEIPILMLHGTADRLVSPAGTRDFFDAVSIPEKELRLYEDGYHEPHNDVDHEQVLADVRAWLERLQPAGGEPRRGSGSGRWLRGRP